MSKHFGFSTRSICTILILSLFIALSAAAGTCVPTQAQQTYTNITDYLTWNYDRNSSIFNLRLSDGRYTGDFPDPISFNGTRVKNLNASADIFLDASSKAGKMHVWFYATDLRPQENVSFTGRFDIYSTDFESEPANSYVPFMQQGIASGIVEHGCTAQGEPSFPQLKGRAATWGHCDVYLNNTLLYSNLWLHTMYTNRFRDPTTNAVFADSSRTTIFSPLQCWQGNVDDSHTEFQFIVARWCYCPDCQVHKPTDVNIIFSFPNVLEL